jgi:transcriptional regulator with XRE-family HTH domain
MADQSKGDPTGFGARLKELRVKAGMSQAQLAEKAGMNLFGVAKLEQGQREPGWGTVLKLAAALGVDCTAFSTPAASDQGAKPEAQAKPAKGKGKK